MNSELPLQEEKNNRYVDHSSQDSNRQHWKVPSAHTVPVETLVMLSGLLSQGLGGFLTNSFKKILINTQRFASQVFSSIDRITQNPGEEKEDPGDKTKSTVLPSTETFSWSSEYSEMYVKCR